MAGVHIDYDRVVSVLRSATTSGGWSQRGLAKEAREGRDVVGDILNGRNKNPTLKVLGNLARALGGDLAMFGVEDDARLDVPTEGELENAILEMLPGMPRGSAGTRARYLAEAVARALRLPPGFPSSDSSYRSRPDAREGDAPPPSATS